MRKVLFLVLFVSFAFSDINDSIRLKMKDLSILPIYLTPTHMSGDQTNSYITIKTVGLYDHFAVKINDDNDLSPDELHEKYKHALDTYKKRLNFQSAWVVE